MISLLVLLIPRRQACLFISVAFFFQLDLYSITAEEVQAPNVRDDIVGLYPKLPLSDSGNNGRDDLGLEKSVNLERNNGRGEGFELPDETEHESEEEQEDTIVLPQLPIRAEFRGNENEDLPKLDRVDAENQSDDEAASRSDLEQLLPGNADNEEIDENEDFRDSNQNEEEMLREGTNNVDVAIRPEAGAEDIRPDHAEDVGRERLESGGEAGGQQPPILPEEKERDDFEDQVSDKQLGVAEDEKEDSTEEAQRLQTPDVQIESLSQNNNAPNQPGAYSQQTEADQQLNVPQLPGERLPQVQDRQNLQSGNQELPQLPNTPQPQFPNQQLPKQNLPQLPNQQLSKQNLPQFPNQQLSKQNLPQLPNQQLPNLNFPLLPDQQLRNQNLPQLPDQQLPYQNLPQLPDQFPNQNLPQLPNQQSPDQNLPQLPDQQVLPSVNQGPSQTPNQDLPRVPSQLLNQDIPQLPNEQNQQDLSVFSKPQQQGGEIPSFQLPPLLPEQGDVIKGSFSSPSYGDQNKQLFYKPVNPDDQKLDLSRQDVTPPQLLGGIIAEQKKPGYTNLQLSANRNEQNTDLFPGSKKSGWYGSNVQQDTEHNLGAASVPGQYQNPPMLSQQPYQEPGVDRKNDNKEDLSESAVDKQSFDEGRQTVDDSVFPNSFGTNSEKELNKENTTPLWSDMDGEREDKYGDDGDDADYLAAEKYQNNDDINYDDDSDEERKTGYDDAADRNDHKELASLKSIWDRSHVKQEKDEDSAEISEEDMDENEDGQDEDEADDNYYRAKKLDEDEDGNEDEDEETEDEADFEDEDEDETENSYDGDEETNGEAGNAWEEDETENVLGLDEEDETEHDLDEDEETENVLDEDEETENVLDEEDETEDVFDEDEEQEEMEGNWGGKNALEQGEDDVDSQEEEEGTDEEQDDIDEFYNANMNGEDEEEDEEGDDVTDDFEDGADSDHRMLEDVVDEDLANRNKPPTGPSSMVLFYTWMVVALLLMVVGISTYQSRFKGVKLPFISGGRQSTREDKRRLLDHEYV
ncbi:protein IWS1 homolog isoform X3 [Aplysia californica]|uniref:Protein IWS1 homolog isoform X3 n=1 Tax=Aplysia californica TaxID=6500 RepID=A0ABM0JKT8_APLCA|nr:protein IWS1 homolog isoform X3 [Aplysia californica]